MRVFILLLLLAIGFTACAPEKDVPVATTIDLDKHLGVWYEIARRKDFFWENNLVGVKLNYTSYKGNKVKEVFEGKRKTLKGKTFKANTHINFYAPGKFKDPFGLKHGVLYLSPDYQYMMYGTLNRKYMWILSRNPVIDLTTYNMLLAKADSLGYPTRNVLITPQAE
jgi:apolipoprotein D and lipocalin family protein